MILAPAGGAFFDRLHYGLKIVRALPAGNRLQTASTPRLPRRTRV